MRGLTRGLAGAGLAGAGLAFVLVAVAGCTEPPVGWQGAGRMQSIPSPQPETGAPTPDAADEAEAGDDSGGGGPDPGAPELDGAFGDDDGGVADASDAG